MGDRFMSHPMIYCGKEGMNDHTVFFARGYGIFATLCGGSCLMCANSGGATPAVYLSFGVAFIVFGVYFGMMVTGMDGGHYLSCKPTLINKVMTASWVPASIIFG